MPWIQIPLWVLGIVLADHLSKGWLHWLDTLFGIGLDTYTEEVFFRRCARNVFKPYVGDGMPMVLVTSLLFGAYHWWSGVGNILAAVLMGVLFMLFYRRSGSLWPVVLSHYLTWLTLLDRLRAMRGPGAP
jgi:uncharacterized protein